MLAGPLGETGAAVRDQHYSNNEHREAQARGLTGAASCETHSFNQQLRLLRTRQVGNMLLPKLVKRATLASKSLRMANVGKVAALTLVSG